MGHEPLSVWGSTGGRPQGRQEGTEVTSDLALLDTSLQWALGFTAIVSEVRGDIKAPGRNAELCQAQHWDPQDPSPLVHGLLWPVPRLTFLDPLLICSTDDTVDPTVGSVLRAGFPCLPSTAIESFSVSLLRKSHHRCFHKVRAREHMDAPIHVCKALPACSVSTSGGWGLRGLGGGVGETGRCGTWEHGQGFVPDKSSLS